MKTWSFGINAYFKTASIYVDEMPMWLYYLDIINHRVCGLIPQIPFPNILPKKRNKLEDCVCYTSTGKKCDEHDSLYTLNEWYGDLHSWWHCDICSPIFQYCWNHKKHKRYSFNVPYDEVRKYFYEDNKKFFDEQESERTDKG